MRAGVRAEHRLAPPVAVGQIFLQQHREGCQKILERGDIRPRRHHMADERTQKRVIVSWYFSAWPCMRREIADAAGDAFRRLLLTRQADERPRQAQVVAMVKL